MKPGARAADDRQLFLNLIGDTRLPNATATRIGQRHVDGFVDVRSRASMSVTAVPGPAPPPATFGVGAA